jgi:hypothetical protein
MEPPDVIVTLGTRLTCWKTKAQIQRLQRILSELGMRGNPTLGKARSLKEARELAAELSECDGSSHPTSSRVIRML